VSAAAAELGVTQPRLASKFASLKITSIVNWSSGDPSVFRCRPMSSNMRQDDGERSKRFKPASSAFELPDERRGAGSLTPTQKRQLSP